MSMRTSLLICRIRQPSFATLSTSKIRYSRRNQSTSSNPPNRPCPKCSTPIPLSTSPCPSCSTLISLPSGLSHYSILNVSTPVLKSNDPLEFDIPKELSGLSALGYDLDSRDMRNRMLQRQKELHPDKFVSQGDDIVGLARGLSGLINKAYEALGDPLHRAEYILSVHDLAPEETASLNDPGLLMEIMEAREELDEASSIEEVQKLRKANHEKVEQTISSIKEAFSETPPNLAGAKALATQLKYWIGLENAAKEWSLKK